MFISHLSIVMTEAVHIYTTIFKKTTAFYYWEIMHLENLNSKQENQK